MFVRKIQFLFSLQFKFIVSLALDILFAIKKKKDFLNMHIFNVSVREKKIGELAKIQCGSGIKINTIKIILCTEIKSEKSTTSTAESENSTTAKG